MLVSEAGCCTIASIPQWPMTLKFCPTLSRVLVSIAPATATHQQTICSLGQSANTFNTIHSFIKKELGGLAPRMGLGGGLPA